MKSVCWGGPFIGKNGNTLARAGITDALRYDENFMARITISVQPRSYDAIIEGGLLQHAGALLRQQFPERKNCFIVTAAPVRRRWGSKLLASLSQAGWAVKVLEMPDGERFKRMQTLENLAEKLVRFHADRHALLLALGGGVVGDVTGFLASVYMRGVDVIQIPTTVLAQVDASIGGKTGVNLKSGKNLVGSFHQPRAVLIDPQVLSTLPDREFRSGLYEAIKCGVIGKPELFRRFEVNREDILSRSPAELQYLISESVKLKAEIVSTDERENGLRRVLNFGHTVGHALETETNYRRYLHGEAVAWGMVAAANIAAEVGILAPQLASRIRETIRNLGPLPKVSSNYNRISRLLVSDKKTRNGKVHFILPLDIGKVEVVDDVPNSIVIKSIQTLRAMSC
jgi:3-dehydroquinate synthase